MPICILWKVRINLLRKLQLTGLFSLVIITMIVAVVRVTVIVNRKSPTARQRVEFVGLYMWSFIEASVGLYFFILNGNVTKVISALLVACLASFRTLFAAQERKTEQQDRGHHENVERAANRTRILSIRARYFQDSLCSIVRTNEDREVNNIAPACEDHPLKFMGSTEPMINTEDITSLRSYQLEDGQVERYV